MINQKIQKLRIDGYSLREISKKLNIPYSTIQRRCKNVKMSETGKKRYHSEVIGLTKKVKIEKGISKEKVRIMSNLLFDGAVYNNKYHYSIMYVNSSKELINEFIRDMFTLYKIKPTTIESEETYYRVKYLSKLIYYDLINYFESFSTSNNKCLIPSIILNNDNFKIIILRAFWENEGSISKDGKLSSDLKNYEVIKQLSKSHNYFGLKHYISRYWKNGFAYKLILNKNKENYQKFIELGLFSKSKVNKGYLKGKKKIDALKEYFKVKYDK